MKKAILAALVSAALAAPALHAAQPAGAAQAPQAGADVYTRAVVASLSKDGQHLYIRLKLVPRSKLPFTTLTYRVLDARLVAGLREGDSVAFRAERRDGENVLTAIQAAASCERFKECK